ncbi:hypothetical protein BC828DRAFT_403656 [Blastocladiella britannica]|nr:hypothetical protein BC828DRAFT_403656 [Blastocladiella britannica]
MDHPQTNTTDAAPAPAPAVATIVAAVVTSPSKLAVPESAAVPARRSPSPARGVSPSRAPVAAAAPASPKAASPKPAAPVSLAKAPTSPSKPAAAAHAHADVPAVAAPASPKSPKSPKHPNSGPVSSPKIAAPDAAPANGGGAEAMDVDESAHNGAGNGEKTPTRASSRKSGSGPVTTPKTRKSIPGGSRKSSSGTPKNKNLVTKEAFELDDLVFARVRGFPSWPARVIDEKDVPERFLRERKSSAEYCVIFFGTFEFGFITKDNLFPFGDNIEALGTSAAAGLARAVKQASEEPDLVIEKLEQIKRKSTDDELADEDDEPKGKGSRKSADKKTPTKASRTSARGSSSAVKRRGAAATEDEEDGDKRSKRARTTEARKESSANSEKLMKWRHCLQKTFIRDKACGEKPRASPEFINTVEWDQVNAVFTEFMAYVESPDFDVAAVNEIKLYKVVRLMHSGLTTATPEPAVLEHDVPAKTQRLLDALKQRMGLLTGDGEGTA